MPQSHCNIHVSNILSSEAAWSIKAKFYVKRLYNGGFNVYRNNPVYMTKVAAMPIYGNNPSRILGLLLQNRCTDYNETWHEASTTKVLQCIYKS